jgi:succinyl-CoA synthetase alpha subunit
MRCMQANNTRNLPVVSFIAGLTAPPGRRMGARSRADSAVSCHAWLGLVVVVTELMSPR